MPPTTWSTPWAPRATSRISTGGRRRTSARRRAGPAYAASSTWVASGWHREDLSPHLRSRHETGETLRASGVRCHRAARFDRAGLGQPLLRADPRARRAAARDDLSALGPGQGAADRHRGCDRLPGRLARACRTRGRGSSRSAAPTRSPTPRSCASTPGSEACAALFIPVPVLTPQALLAVAGPDHAGLRARRTQADRGRAQPHRGHRRRCAARLRRPPDEPERGDRPRHAQRGSQVRP